METTSIKLKRSVRLTPTERRRLKSFLLEKTVTEAVYDLKISRESLIRINLIGSGAEKTIIKLRNNLPK